MVTFGIEVISNFDEYNKPIKDKKFHCANVPGLEKFYSGIFKYLMKNHLKVFDKLDDGSGKP